jgi:hypothetical protein
LRDKRNGRGGPRLRAAIVLVTLLTLAHSVVRAQTCTTQARMTGDIRNGLSEVALNLAQAVQQGDGLKVQGMTIAEFSDASAFAPTMNLVRSTSSHVANDALRVTQIYELDASGRVGSDASDADFSCPLIGTTAETDFSIAGLPNGLYGFAMVEATGARPWLLSFLLRRDGGVWKLAGFYPRATAAAGHDGVWYWNSARTYAKADELWLAWIFYGEAAELLRPANFVTSTNLDRLLSERRAAAPPELVSGIGSNDPLVVKSRDSKGTITEYRLTDLSAEESADGKEMNLILHLQAGDVNDPAILTARSKAAAQAVLDAHMELRQAFHEVWIFTGSQGHEPLVSEQTISTIP